MGGNLLKELLKRSGTKVRAIAVASLLALSVALLALYATASSAKSTDMAVQASLGALSVDESKSIFDAEQFKTAQCMKSRGFEYRPNEWAPSAEAQNLSNTEPPRSFNSDLLAQMTADQQLAWNTALLGERPIPGRPNPSRASFSVDGVTMSVDLSSCASQGRSAVYGDEIKWMKALIAAQQLPETSSPESRRVIAEFEGLQREALNRAHVLLGAS
jgi:hypothetical protein